jgi:hypothetical protein
MNHYLMVFDRPSGQVVHEAVYSDRHEALRARFDAERQHSEDPNIEVVVLAADSSEALKRTHARYFKPVRGLLQSALAKSQVIRDAGPRTVHP